MPRKPKKTLTPAQPLLLKRIKFLLNAWELVKLAFPDDLNGCYLNKRLVRRTAQDYLNDHEAYKNRWRIKDASKIKLHKIAGLMTAPICKNKPVQCSDDTCKSDIGNERLAIWYGLAVCGEKYQPRQGEIYKSITGCQEFRDWEKEAIRFLKRKPDSAEAMIMIFHTFCLHYMPTVIELPSKNGVVSKPKGYIEH